MPEYNEDGLWRDRARAAASGALMSWNDEAEAGLRALAQLDPSAYDKEVARIRAQQAAYSEARPWESIGYEAAGAILPSLAMPATGLARAAPGLARLAVKGGRLGKAAFRAAPEVAMGAAYGAGAAENVADIPSSMLTEGVIGGLGYGVMNKVGQVARPALTRASQAVRGLARTAPEVAGLQQLQEAFHAGASYDDLRAMAQELNVTPDPAALRVNVLLRDDAIAKGVAADPRVGQFVPKPSDYSAEVPAIGQPLPLQGEDMRGVHIGRTSGLSQLDPSFYGRGHQGQEYKQARKLGLPDRTYFYAGEAGNILPEEPVMRGGERFAYEGNLNNLYNVNSDPAGIVDLLRKYHAPRESSLLPDMENIIRDYGYSGYSSDTSPSWAPNSRRSAAVFGPTDVVPIALAERYAVGGLVR